MALVEFLGHELVPLVDHSGVECLPKHTRFVAKFRKGEYTAIDDGLLQVKHRPSEAKNSNILAILEVKPRQRTKMMQRIQMQESAEMAAWILTTSPELSAFNNYCLLVAQDRHEIYLVYASYRCDYLRYLKGDGPVTPKAFLTMRANGPLDTKNADYMEGLAIIIVAMILTVKRKL
ncbi:hypothetical protein V8E54_006175 [Elaphomyces granulatus]